MANPADRTRKLYDRFRSEAGAAAISDIYTEDQLIDIYDYAADNNDDFTKLEVLLYAARVVPDSEVLRSRREYLYYYLGADDGVTTLLNNRTEHTYLSRLLQLRANALPATIKSAEIEKLVRDADHPLDDEEVIQTIAISAESDNPFWAEKHIEMLKEKAEYPATALYETAATAEQQVRYDVAANMLEELTMIEPFEAEHWMRLAQIKLMDNKGMDALQALEYALAIDPEATRARYLRACALAMTDPTNPEAPALLKQLLNEGNIDDNGMAVLAECLDAQGYAAEAADLLYNWCMNTNDNAKSFSLLLQHDDPARIYNALDKAILVEEVESWLLWIATLTNKELYHNAAMVAQAGVKRGILDLHSPIVAEAMYRAKKYAEICEIYLSDGAQLHPQSATVALMALIRMGEPERAKTLLHSMLEKVVADPAWVVGRYDDNAAVSQLNCHVVLYGFQSLLNQILNALIVTPPLPVDDYDPLILHP